MRMQLLLFSGVLVIGLMVSACPSRGGGSGDDAGTSDDSGSGGGGPDGGLPSDAGTGGTESGCSVALQQGCDAGDACLRGQEEDGGQGNICFPGECDVVAQNCTAGNRCTYVREGSETHRRCVPDGTASEGGDCQTNNPGPDGAFYDTCKAGLYCASDDGTSFSCRKFCYDSDPCTAPQDCIQVLRFTGSAELPRVCATPGPSCDPLAPGCADSLGCYPSSKSGAVCVAAGTLTEGMGCTYSNDCQPGSACVKDGATQACRHLCRAPSGSPSCASGQCQPLQGFTGVGACVP